VTLHSQTLSSLTLPQPGYLLLAGVFTVESQRICHLKMIAGGRRIATYAVSED